MTIALVILIVLAAFSISLAVTGLIEKAFGMSAFLALLSILLATAVIAIKLDVRDNYTYNGILVENNVTLDNSYFKSYVLFYEK